MGSWVLLATRIPLIRWTVLFGKYFKYFGMGPVIPGGTLLCSLAEGCQVRCGAVAMSRQYGEFVSSTPSTQHSAPLGRASHSKLRLALDVAVVVAGVALLVWGIVEMAAPTISCRGVKMHPGDTCHKATYTATYTDTVQTYEQRHRSIAQSRPTVIGLGAVLTVFGAVMSWQTVKVHVHSSDSPIGP